jgi:hypothetical protein
MKIKKTRDVLVVDVGSATVGAGIVTGENNTTLVLHEVRRESIHSGSQKPKEHLEKNMFEALGRLLDHYSHFSYHMVRISVAAPWYRARIRIVHSETDKPETISEKKIVRMVEQYKNETPPQTGAVDIEAVAVQVEVNEYPTSLTRPVSGKKTRINLYESEMPDGLHKEFIRLIGEKIRATRYMFNTFPLVSTAALRSIVLQHSFVCIDIGGEVTEISVMYADGIHFFGSIPRGYWTLVRDIDAQKTGDTYSRLTLYAQEQLSAEEMSNVDGVFKKALANWMTEFESLLQEASALVPLPSAVYVMSDAEPALWFKKGIEENNTLSLKPHLVSNAMTQRFFQIGTNGTYDIFLALAIIFFHISEKEVFGEPVPTKMV